MAGAAVHPAAHVLIMKREEYLPTNNVLICFPVISTDFSPGSDLCCKLLEVFLDNTAPAPKIQSFELNELDGNIHGRNMVVVVGGEICKQIEYSAP